MSRRSRSAIDAATSSTLPPISRTRRAARSCGDAVMNSLSVASGNTTVPMSRPSMTPPPWSPRPGALAGAQLGADTRVGGHGADGGGHLAAADLGRDVIAVDEHAVVGHAQRHRAGQLGDGILVGDRDAAAQRGTRHRPVHRPGVEVLEPEAGGEGVADGALAGTGGTVDGDQQLMPLTQRTPSSLNGHPALRAASPSRYPARLCTPTTARSANSASDAAPAYVHAERTPATI